MDISILRIAGILVGLALCFGAMRSLRLAADKRANVWIVLAIGCGLIIVAAAPEVATVFRDILQLGDLPGGRIVSLLLAFSGLLAFVVLVERARRVRLQNQWNTWVRNNAVERFVVDLEKLPPPDAVVIVIPAFNEASNLQAVLPRVPKQLDGRPVVTLMVDDGSTDGTDRVARGLGASVIRLPFNFGQGGAVRIGLGVAEALGVDICVTMDADGQHQPEEIGQLVAPLLHDEADIVIGSRVLGQAENASIGRWAGVHLFSLIIRTLMGVKISDCASGFRAFRVSCLPLDRLEQNQYLAAEVIIMAAKHRLRICERPMTVTRRAAGVTKKGSDISYGFLFLRAIVKTWLR